MNGANIDTSGGNISTSAGSITTTNLNATTVNATTINATVKNFDIEHPTKKEPWRLRHSALEGPEIGAYVRGRLTNTNVIDLPYYWTDLVHEESITVSLTSIGNSTQYFVEKIEENLVYVGSIDGYIDLYYLVIAERKDVNKLVVEYKKEN